jgi:hypothetical protein
LAHRVPELREELVPVAALRDVPRQILRFGHVLQQEVVV